MADLTLDLPHFRKVTDDEVVTPGGLYSRWSSGMITLEAFDKATDMLSVRLFELDPDTGFAKSSEGVVVTLSFEEQSALYELLLENLSHEDLLQELMRRGWVSEIEA